MEDLDRAVALRKEGRYEEAREILVRLAAEKPLDPQVQYQAAWVHDAMGREEEAVPYYRRAIEEGLEGEDLAGAMIGLGSTYRCLGRYKDARQTLEAARGLFPENRAIQVFLAMAYHNLEQHDRSAEILLRNLAETSEDPEIRRYQRAILAYAPCLRDVWDSG